MLCLFCLICLGFPSTALLVPSGIVLAVVLGRSSVARRSCLSLCIQLIHDLCIAPLKGLLSLAYLIKRFPDVGRHHLKGVENRGVEICVLLAVVEQP